MTTPSPKNRCGAQFRDVYVCSLETGHAGRHEDHFRYGGVFAWPAEPRHYAAIGSTNADCDETVPRSAKWYAQSGEWADARFTNDPEKVTCPECVFRKPRLSDEHYRPEVFDAMQVYLQAAGGSLSRALRLATHDALQRG